MALGRFDWRVSWFAVAYMNLQVNFIAPSEIRSASVVSAKSLLQITAIIVPLAIALLFASAYFSYAEQNSKRELIEGTWTSTERTLTRAQELTQKLQDHQRALAEVEGWEQSLYTWPAFLADFRELIPPAIQVQAMRARQNLEASADGQPQRSLQIIMSGRAKGPDAEGRVESVRLGLATRPTLAAWVKEAKVTGFREDTDVDAEPDDRSFQIEVNFFPRRLNAVAAR